MVRQSTRRKERPYTFALRSISRHGKLLSGFSNKLFFTIQGVFRGGYEVLVRSKLALSTEGGVTMQLSVRSGDADVSELVASAVG